MKKIDEKGFKLCKIQGRLFERSRVEFQGSSPMFIKLFMNGETAKLFDDGSILFLSTGIEYNELGLPRNYLKEKAKKPVLYSANELNWIGYMYRYWCYTRGLTSLRAYRLIPSTKFLQSYLPMHTQDPEVALRTVIESQGLADYDLCQTIVEAYRKEMGLK